MSNTEDGKFQKRTRETLMAWAGAECSAPWCSTRTIAGSSSTRSGVSDVGEAAHILGRTPSSARYDAHQTDADRKHFDNGIWLCRTHAAAIDRNDSIFTKELLEQWKEARHEEARRDQLNMPRTQLRELFAFSIELDLTSNLSVQRIVEFMEASGVSVAWGADVQGTAARLLFEILDNAYRHGLSLSATLQASATQVEIAFDSPAGHFGVDQLLTSKNGRGGHVGASSWYEDWNAQFRLASYPNGTITTWSLTDVRDGVGASGPCSAVVGYGRMTDTHHRPYTFVADCSEVVLYIDGHVSYSDVFQLTSTVDSALANGPVLIVSKYEENLRAVEAVNKHAGTCWKLTRSGSALRIEV
ncbi:hypothetical protein EDF28_3745 [Curtobacterium sp. PhB137]|uniref:hypothetical protein n=1 Tax=Curtobacterium sp. PhB137 TaxID=2485182 RepID=UPI000F506566|nr:hypothetical protein [Curtobacterium sp. PhB137]RPE75392.1 hypothetical protein EDF28_3745 [Curtobacterium sp. PhB137]